HGRAPRCDDCRGYQLFPIPELLSLLSRARGFGTIPGTLLVAASVFYYSDFAYDSGNRDFSSGDYYSNPSAALALRSTSRHRSLAIPRMAECFNHRGCDL